MKFTKIRTAMIAIFLVLTLSIVGACSVQPTISPTVVSEEPTVSSTITPIDKTSSLSQIPVIWDDDGSPDGVIALLYLLKNAQVRVEALTVSCGEAHPNIFAQNLTRMLARIGRRDIPIAAGRATPLEGDNAFPEAWRQSTDIFWGVELFDAEESIESIPASQLIVDIVNRSSEPVTILLTGNHTNLAEALRLDPSIVDQINVVEVMGGALHVPGNIASDWPDIPNQVAEWNIWVDPIAAEEVFKSSLSIRLVPLDATNQVVWTEEDAAAWESSETPEGVLASEILRWMLSSWFPDGVYAWDVVAAVDMTDSDVCQHINQYVSIATQPGNDQGQTLVDDSQLANTSICITPFTSLLKGRVAEVFQSP
jgi:pyrimidine-specific ribonucleoside hydrolase